MNVYRLLTIVGFALLLSGCGQVAGSAQKLGTSVDNYVFGEAGIHTIRPQFRRKCLVALDKMDEITYKEADKLLDDDEFDKAMLKLEEIRTRRAKAYPPPVTVDIASSVIDGKYDQTLATAWGCEGKASKPGGIDLGPTELTGDPP